MKQYSKKKCAWEEIGLFCNNLTIIEEKVSIINQRGRIRRALEMTGALPSLN